MPCHANSGQSSSGFQPLPDRPRLLFYSRRTCHANSGQSSSGFQRKDDLVAALAKHLAQFPGVQLNFTQPIQNAFDELLSGSKAQLGASDTR